MSKHTPGPWRDQHFDAYTHVIRGPNDYYVCATPAYSGEVAAANARLIAAAPELLEALKSARNVLSEPYQVGVLGKVEAAIAKAEGA